MAKRKVKKTTSDAVAILYNRYFKGNRKRIAALEQELQNARIAQAIYDLRTSAGLTQKQLAEYMGTSHTAISRLENSDYNGHSLQALRKIAEVFSAKMLIHLVPAKETQKYLIAPSGAKTEFEEVLI